MKIGRLFGYLGIFVFGAVIVSGIDYLLGISFKDVSAVASIMHKITYMLWGSIIILIVIKEKA